MAALRDDFIDTIGQHPAGLAAELAGMYAHLIGEAGDAHPRQTASDADGAERLEQIDGAMLDALCGCDAGRSTVTEQRRFGRPEAFEHVEPVGEQRRSLVQPVALIDGDGKQRSQHAGLRMAPAEIGLGTLKRRPQRFLTEQHLSFPDVAKACEELAPAPGIDMAFADAAARHYFIVPARRLTPRQAVTLAAMLRNPQREAARWAQEGSVDRDRLAWIAQQVRGVPVRQRRALVAQLQAESSLQAVTSVPADRTAMIVDGL